MAPETVNLGRVRVAQLIAAAILGGAFVFLMVVVLVNGSRLTDFRVDPLALVGVLIGLSSMAAALIVPPFLAEVETKKLGHQASLEASAVDQRLGEIFTTCTIIRFAMLESAVFFNAVLLFVSPSLLLAVVAAVALAAMVVAFPTTGRARNWAEPRRRDLLGN